MQVAAAERRGRREDNREVRVGVATKDDTGDIGPVGGSPQRNTAATEGVFDGGEVQGKRLRLAEKESQHLDVILTVQ